MCSYTSTDVSVSFSHLHIQHSSFKLHKCQIIVTEQSSPGVKWVKYPVKTCRKVYRQTICCCLQSLVTNAELKINVFSTLQSRHRYFTSVPHQSSLLDFQHSHWIKMQSCEYIKKCLCVSGQILDFSFSFSTLRLSLWGFVFRTFKQYLLAVGNVWMCVCVPVCVYTQHSESHELMYWRNMCTSPPCVSYKVIKLRFIEMWML